MIDSTASERANFRDGVVAFVEMLLGSEHVPQVLAPLIEVALSEPGKLLARSLFAPWTEFVWAGCRLTGGSAANATSIAACCELLLAALDIIDDLEDGDSSTLIATCGPAQALNVANALLFLSQWLPVSSYSANLTAEQRLDILHTLSAHGLLACAGQHLDIAAEGQELTLSQTMEIAQAKSGNLTQSVICAGALLGSLSPDDLTIVGQWGYHFGTAVQLANDFQDVDDDSSKSDRARQKGTLAVVFARHLLGQEAVAEPLAYEGGKMLTWLAYQHQRRRCLELLDQLAERGYPVRYLPAL